MRNVLLTMNPGTAHERSFQLRREVTLVGRSVHCHLRVPLPSVGDRHCEIRNEHTGLTIVSLDPEHELAVNGARIQRSPLRHQDRLQIGSVVFAVRVLGEDALIPDIEVKRLGLAPVPSGSRAESVTPPHQQHRAAP